MPSATPQKIKDEIIRLHLLGNTNHAIAGNLGTSTGNVSNILSEFKQAVDEGDYQSLLYLVKLCKNNNVGYSNAFECISLNSILEKNNIEHSKIEDYIHAYLKLPGDLSPDHLVDHSLKLLDISRQTKIELTQIPNHYQGLLEKSEELQSNINSMQNQIKELKKETEKALEEKNTTHKVLQEFYDTQKELNSLGVDVDDHKTLAQMLRSAKLEDYNLSKIIKQISKVNSLDEQILEQETEIAKMERDIKNYKEIVELCEKDFSDKKTKLDTLNEEYKDEQRTTRAIKGLRKSGVTNADIERWENTRKQYDDPVQFDEHLKDAKKYMDFILKLQSQISQLKSENSKLQGQNNALDQEIKSKESQLQTMDQRLSKFIETKIAEIVLVVKNIKTHFKEKLEYHDIAIRARLDNGLTRFEQDLKEFLPKLDEQLAQIMSVYGDQKRLEFLEPLYQLFANKKADKKEVFHSMVLLLESLEIWIKTNKNYGMKITIKNLRGDFKKQLDKMVNPV